VPAVLVDEPPEQASDPVAAVVLDLPGGGRLSILASAPPALASAALKALR
jgi:transposase